RGQRHLLGCADPPSPALLRQNLGGGITREWLIYGGGVAGVIACWQLIQYQQLIGQLLVGFGGLMLLVVVAYALFKCTPIDRDRMLVAATLMLFSILFWALFEQAGSS